MEYSPSMPSLCFPLVGLTQAATETGFVPQFQIVLFLVFKILWVFSLCTCRMLRTTIPSRFFLISNMDKYFCNKQNVFKLTLWSLNNISIKQPIIKQAFWKVNMGSSSGTEQSFLHRKMSLNLSSFISNHNVGKINIFPHIIWLITIYYYVFFPFEQPVTKKSTAQYWSWFHWLRTPVFKMCN